MPRFNDVNGVIPVIESKDYGSAGIDGDSFNLDLGVRAAILLNFGAITGNSALLVYAGATAGAKTTAVAFRYRQSRDVFKASTLADLYAASVDVPATGLTLTAATFRNTTLVIDLEEGDLPAGKPYITLSVSSVATVLNMAALAVLQGAKFLPPLTAIV